MFGNNNNMNAHHATGGNGFVWVNNNTGNAVMAPISSNGFIWTKDANGNDVMKRPGI